MLGEQGWMEEARAYIERALGIHREVGNRPTEGVLLGSLGALEAREGRWSEARAAFTAGERLLRAVDARYELAKLLCARGEAEAQAGDLARAHQALAEAASLATTLGAGPTSKVGRALASLRRALGEDAAGR